MKKSLETTEGRLNTVCYIVYITIVYIALTSNKAAVLIGNLLPATLISALIITTAADHWIRKHFKVNTRLRIKNNPLATHGIKLMAMLMAAGIFVERGLPRNTEMDIIIYSSFMFFGHPPLFPSLRTSGCRNERKKDWHDCLDCYKSKRP
jgi:hypothetical protein